MIWPGEKTAKNCVSFVKINGTAVDLAPLKVFRIPEGATIFLQGKKRGYLIDGVFVDQDKAKEEVLPDSDGFYNLDKGTYEIRLPKVSIPLSATGFIYPRSTFNRLGVIKSETAVWDPGYSGEGSQTFFFPTKARIHKNEAWVQIVFMGNESGDAKTNYSGHYQEEKVKTKIP
jgi:deoxycytidine triphosphate deaminase